VDRDVRAAAGCPQRALVLRFEELTTSPSRGSGGWRCETTPPAGRKELDRQLYQGQTWAHRVAGLCLGPPGFSLGAGPSFYSYSIFLSDLDCAEVLPARRQDDRAMGGAGALMMAAAGTAGALLCLCGI